jgi:KUP system potassium uptake protein
MNTPSPEVAANPAAEAPPPASHHAQQSLIGLAILAMGVVYGDIGTSPLYTLNEVFFPEHAFPGMSGGLPVTRDNVLGILSLIFWALTSVVAIKYAVFVLRADNQGEGGTMALLSLALRVTQASKTRRVLTLLGLFGVALFFADSIITPAMSILAAAEGLPLIHPGLQPVVIPATIAIIIGLFAIQSRGSGKMGLYFGPIMGLWFLTLAALGVYHLAQNPSVLAALSPHHGLRFAFSNGFITIVVFGAVTLAITGAEALYADMGHFGKHPIRAAWFAFVMPSLVLNYFGQGALLLTSLETGQKITHVFYQQVSHEGLRIGLVVLAMMAAIIASQAVISGAFSIARQAMLLGYSPRFTVKHTSHQAQGQIYLPAINWLLCILVILLVLQFQTSSRLGVAYGFAVTGAMIIDTFLIIAVLRRLWQWQTWQTVLFATVFIIIDGVFFMANAIKIPSGGWFPLLIATCIFILMTTWNRGRALLAEQRRSTALPMAPMIDGLCADAKRVEGTAVFMTSTPADMPAAMLHNLKHNRVLHERVILLTVKIEDVPLIGREHRVEVEEMAQGFYRVLIRYGFMNTPDVPKALRHCEAETGLHFDMMDTSFFVSRETLVPTTSPRMALWRQRLCVLLARNSQPAHAFFKIPTNRVLELGAQVKI